LPRCMTASRVSYCRAARLRDAAALLSVVFASRAPLRCCCVVRAPSAAAPMMKTATVARLLLRCAACRDRSVEDRDRWSLRYLQYVCLVVTIGGCRSIVAGG
ncbi:hypothetical protein Dimus_021287, partial [Dionaea muscipula]